MVSRLIKLSKSNSLFLFGARGTGKSTLLREHLGARDRVLWIDLLSEADEERYLRNPSVLSEELNTGNYSFVVIDEVQKSPKLLDIVHQEIEKKRGVQFFLSGSSARKLKRGGANLLAGRAFTFNLFPLTHLELGAHFSLEETLRFGALPKLLELSDDADKTRYLKSYVKTYLREEILVEQVVRNLEPFQDFLEIAAQTNGQIVNFSKIAKDIGVDDKTVKSYFQILVDTLLGVFLPPFHRSIRKRQREAPKFYLFDLGVKRTLDNSITLPLQAHTTEYGNSFEHFIIFEIIRLDSYLERDLRFSYLRTKDDAEIDLVIERPGKPDLLIEIKSYQHASEDDAKKLARLMDSWDHPVEAMLISNDVHYTVKSNVKCMHWRDALARIFSDAK